MPAIMTFSPMPAMSRSHCGITSLSNDFHILRSFLERNTGFSFRAVLRTVVHSAFIDGYRGRKRFHRLAQPEYAPALCEVAESEWADDPFVALKAGLELPLFGRLFLDVNASYRFDSDAALDDAFEDIDTDTVFLGGAVRFGF